MNEYKLWYDKPAEGWSQGLPLGNGRIGAVVISSPDREVWEMSEVTFWSGQAEAVPGNGRGKEALEEMRAAFFAGDYERGDRLAKQSLMPVKSNFGTHLGLCRITLDFADVKPDPAGENFRRELDLSQALVRSFSEAEGGLLKREVFASHPGDVLAARIWRQSPERVSFTLTLQGITETFETHAAAPDTLEFRAQATERVHSSGKCGVWSQGQLKIVTAGGSVECGADTLRVTGAEEAWIYFTVATDYRKEDAGWAEESSRALAGAVAAGYERLRGEHIADYRREFGTVELELGHPQQSVLPTDERMRRLRQGEGGDPQLYALFLQYGRYLMIAGSRTDSPLPLHLQGIWNDGEACRMGWSCDYHLDVNTQMNYYPAEVIGLGDSHLPLMAYIEDLAQAGRASARDFYGAAGWVAHVFSNAWGFTAPGWDTSWGLNVTGGLWLAAHMMEHFRYSRDTVFLKNQAYPVLKEAAVFFLDYMTIHPKYGWLVTGPSNSPENHFYPDGPESGVQQLSMGTTVDQELVRELFEFCHEAAGLLGVDEEFRAQLAEAIGKLPPLQIGSRGQLQEWLEDYAEAQPEHRHFSHLYALYPGSQITPEDTPELAAAMRVTLENRMLQDELEDVEFTAALFALGFARLHDGDQALRHVSHLIGELCFDNLLSYSRSGIAETNIFVIDGNFGGTAAIAEMLLQSHAGCIHLLPALPAAWGTGKVTGLRAKGNAEVDITWENGELTGAVIRTHLAGLVAVRCGGRKIVLEAAAGGVYMLDAHLQELQGRTP
jgi:alpha-L-fucosidase 2